nr:MAG TPA: CdiI immunity protein [Caudoviricetes sp.]
MNRLLDTSRYLKQWRLSLIELFRHKIYLQ